MKHNAARPPGGSELHHTRLLLARAMRRLLKLRRVDAAVQSAVDLKARRGLAFSDAPTVADCQWLYDIHSAELEIRYFPEGARLFSILLVPHGRAVLLTPSRMAGDELEHARALVYGVSGVLQPRDLAPCDLLRFSFHDPEEAAAIRTLKLDAVTLGFIFAWFGDGEACRGDREAKRIRAELHLRETDSPEGLAAALVAHFGADEHLGAGLSPRGRAYIQTSTIARIHFCPPGTPAQDARDFAHFFALQFLNLKEAPTC